MGETQEFLEQKYRKWTSVLPQYQETVAPVPQLEARREEACPSVLPAGGVGETCDVDQNLDGCLKPNHGQGENRERKTGRNP